MNICVEESRLFLTKERAPFMICLELYRPEEIKLAANDYKNSKRKEALLEDEFSPRKNSIKAFFGNPSKSSKKYR